MAPEIRGPGIESLEAIGLMTAPRRETAHAPSRRLAVATYTFPAYHLPPTASRVPHHGSRLRRPRADRDCSGELSEFLSIPSVSTLPAHAADCRRAAEWLRDRAREPRLPRRGSDRGGGASGGVGRESARAGAADAPHLRPLRRPAARSARRVGSPAVRADGAGRQAVRARRRRRQGPGVLPAQGLRGGARTRTAARRSTSTSSSRARRSAADG